MKRTLAALAASLGVCSALLPAAASAQTSDQWQYGAIIYGWLPTIGGNTTFPAGTGSSIDIDANTILSHLKFTFMGAFEARKDQWGVYTDLIYLNVGGSKSAHARRHPRRRAASRRGNRRISTWTSRATIWTIAGEYRVATDPTASVDVLGGARLADLQAVAGMEFQRRSGSLQSQPQRQPGGQRQQMGCDRRREGADRHSG